MRRPVILAIGTALPEARMKQMDICYGMDGAYVSLDIAPVPLPSDPVLRAASPQVAAG